MANTEAATRELRLTAAEAELVGEEVATVARLHPDPAARTRYAELAEVVAGGTVAEERLEQLTTILEIGLQSGRIRRVYGADGELALGRIYSRTPRGAEASQAASAVTDALRALHGQVIYNLRITALGPGAYSLLVDTRECQITIRLDRTGVRVDNIALGI
ncbi:MAG TPA: hypothetical protein VFZ25_10410 [Chloroflexota bacterium]|nr:hypothetical protein [Chloroflexota bacterium]